MKNFIENLKIGLCLLLIPIVVIGMIYVGWAIKVWTYKNIYGIVTNEELVEMKEEIKILKEKVDKLGKRN